MTRLVSAVVFAAAFAVPCGALWAQDNAATMYQAVLGEWTSETETPRGVFTQEFRFVMDGDVLKGYVSGRQGETPLSKLEFAGGKLTFQLERSFGGNAMAQVLTATVDGDEMRGTITGGRGGERPFFARRKAT